MKLLHVIHSLRSGGAETQLALLTRELADNGHEVVVYCVNNNARLAKNIKVIKSSNPDLYPFVAGLDLRKIIANENPDIVHLWLPPKLTIPCMLVAALHKKPCITSFRNRMAIKSFVSIFDVITQFIFTKKVISNNPINQSSPLHRALYYRKKGTEIPNAVNIPDRLVGAALNTSLPDRILLIGRLVEQKNFSLLIQATRLLMSSGYNVSYTVEIFGRGELDDSLKYDVKRAGLTDIFLFKGFTPDLYESMCLGGILVVPSLYEGMPNVVLEAARCGLPILMSDIPAHRNLYGDCEEVIWFNPSHASSLATALRIVLSDTFDLTGYARALHEFSPHLSPKEMCDLYVREYCKLLSADNSILSN